MEGITLFVAIAVGCGALFGWRAYRRRRLPLAEVGVRCPENNCAATVTVRTDPAARTGTEYVDVVGCSLLSDAGICLPARRAYLPDAPPLPLLMEPAPGHPIYGAAPACGRGCIHVLNEASPALVRSPIEYTSGTAIDLLQQAERRPRITRLLWYGGA